MPNRIFSGIRPSGKLHLGNYLGAIKNWIELQDKPDTERAIFAVVDYHGITTPFDPQTYHQQVMDTILDFLAAGINPEKSLLIRQSKVPEHTELAWIFNTITPVSWLDRLPTYREKLGETGGKYNHMGLLDYPVLMAADILLYKSNLVPVGEDQLPHIDLTNEIAKKFNSMFGQTFEPVKPYLATGASPHTKRGLPELRTEGADSHYGVGARIMSLQDPAKKMSKSPSAGSGRAGDEYIALSDNPDEIRDKIKRAVTDSGKEIIFDPDKKPAVSNLMTIYHLLSQNSVKEIEKKYGGKNYSEFKSNLAEVVVNFLKPFQEKRKELSEDMTFVEDLLTESEEKAREIAHKNLEEIKQKMGLL